MWPVSVTRRNHPGNFPDRNVIAAMVESKTVKSSWGHKAGVVAILLGLVGAINFMVACAPRQPASADAVAPWNPGAMQTSYAGVRVEQIDASNAAIVFLYDVDNRSGSDYQLIKGPGVVIMSRLKSSGALSSEKPVNLDASAFVPMRNRTRIALEITEPFNWPTRIDTTSENRFRQLLAQEVADLEGFVIFDQSHRYQIDLPGAWPAMEEKPESR